MAREKEFESVVKRGRLPRVHPHLPEGRGKRHLRIPKGAAEGLVGAASLEGLSLPLSFELDAICLKVPGAGRYQPGAPGLRRGGQGRLPGGVGGGGGWREEERSVRLPASGPKRG
jgi:hypothetical protein